MYTQANYDHHLGKVCNSMVIGLRQWFIVLLPCLMSHCVTYDNVMKFK